MTNFDYTDLSRLLIDSLNGYGIACSEHQAELLLKHLDLVIEKNKVMNLTRIVDPAEAVYLHIVDSLLILAAEPCISGSGRLLDIGTGAGFPGIPLAVMTDLKAVLIDSVGKKITAVNEFVSALGLAKRVRCDAIRAEELARKSQNSFDYVVARAVSQTNTLVEYAAPLLKMQGSLIVCKANPSDEELSVASRAAQICGLENVSRETFELPQGLGHREILTYKKVRKSQIKLPRRTGLAQHEPLGL